MRVPASITNRVEDADLVMTLKNYYRRKAPVVRDAEMIGKPVYVLKNNTIAQMQSALAGIYSLGHNDRDDSTVALRGSGGCHQPGVESLADNRASSAELACAQAAARPGGAIQCRVSEPRKGAEPACAVLSQASFRRASK